MTEKTEEQKRSTPVNGEAKITTQAKQDDLVGKVATVAVVGVGAALISAELIPGILIGAAAAFLPNFMPKLRQGLRPTVRAGYKFAQKTREVFAEAGEQVQDMVAEARLEHTQSQAATSDAVGAVQETATKRRK